MGAPGDLRAEGYHDFYEGWRVMIQAIDIGDFCADSSRIGRTLGWRPIMPLAEGLARTVAFYGAHMQHYVPAAMPAGAL